jgi:hypothetical protein
MASMALLPIAASWRAGTPTATREPRVLARLWKWMFSLGLYLNCDLSRPMWMGIDPSHRVVPRSVLDRDGDALLQGFGGCVGDELGLQPVRERGNGGCVLLQGRDEGT